MPESVGRAIRKWREKRSYSQAELATLAGLKSPSLVSRAEANLTLPTLETMKAIARVLAADDELWPAYQYSQQERKESATAAPIPLIAIPDTLLASPVALISPRDAAIGVSLEPIGLPTPQTSRESDLSGNEFMPNFVVYAGPIAGTSNLPRSIATLFCEYTAPKVEEMDVLAPDSRYLPKSVDPTRELTLVTAMHIVPTDDRGAMPQRILYEIQRGCSDLQDSAERQSLTLRISAAFNVPTTTVQDFLEKNRPRWQLYFSSATVRT